MSCTGTHSWILTNMISSIFYNISRNTCPPPYTQTNTNIHIPFYARNCFSVVSVLCLLKWKLPPSIKWLPPKNAVIWLKYCRYGVKSYQINMVHVLIQTKSFLLTLMLPIYKQALMITNIIFILFYAMLLKHVQCFLIL